MKWLILWIIGVIAWITTSIFLGWIALISGLTVFIILTGLLIYFYLAPNNLCFTFVKEGTAKIVVKGDKFVKVLLQWVGYTLDQEWNIIPEGWYKNGKLLEVFKVIDEEKGKIQIVQEVVGAQEEWVAEEMILDGKMRKGVAVSVVKVLDEEKGILDIVMEINKDRDSGRIGGATKRMIKDDTILDILDVVDKKIGKVKVIQEIEDAREIKESRHPLGGLRCYGFWPVKDIYIYDFEWTGVTEGGQIQPHPKETLDYILVKDDVYWAKIEKTEDVNRLPLTLELFFTIRVFNPYKSLFRVENWLETVLNRARTRVRNVITSKSYEEWISQPEAVETAIWERLQKEGVLDDYRDRYGVEVRAIEVRNIDPPEDYRRTTLEKYSAEREKDKIVVGADAEKQRIDTIYGIINKYGDLGRLLRVCEAVEKSSLAASLTVQAIPGIQEIFRGVFGKTPETVSSQEFRELKETIGRLITEKGG